jgi:hypothetical protein
VARERPSTYLHTNTNTQPHGFGCRIHCGVEVTVLTLNRVCLRGINVMDLATLLVDEAWDMSFVYSIAWEIVCEMVQDPDMLK